MCYPLTDSAVDDQSTALADLPLPDSFGNFWKPEQRMLEEVSLWQADPQLDEGAIGSCHMVRALPCRLKVCEVVLSGGGVRVWPSLAWPGSWILFLVVSFAGKRFASG